MLFLCVSLLCKKHALLSSFSCGLRKQASRIIFLQYLELTLKHFHQQSKKKIGKLFHNHRESRKLQSDFYYKSLLFYSFLNTGKKYIFPKYTYPLINWNGNIELNGNAKYYWINSHIFTEKCRNVLICEYQVLST